MSRIDSDFEALNAALAYEVGRTALPSGAQLIEVRDYLLPQGWSRDRVTILFLAPAGYPAAQPDCFWLSEPQFRLAGGATPQATNDNNPIPEVGLRGTWFSWHVQSWNPNTDNLLIYFRVIEQRLNPPR